MLKLTTGLGLSGPFAVSGGGGGGDPPTEPPATPTIWWDASEIVGLSNGDPVTTWPDKAGSTDLTTLLGTPTFVANAQNSLPAVRLDGVDSVMDAGAVALTAPLTIAVVAKMTGDGSTAPTIISGGSQKILLYGTDGGTNQIKGGVNADLVLASETVPMSAFHVMAAVFANSGSNFWLDGAAKNPASDLVGTAATVDQILLGFGPADICELIIYDNQALSSGDIGVLNDYLLAKYGLA